MKEAIFAGADINQDRDGKSPLLWAILLKRHNALEALLEWGAKVDDLSTQVTIKNKDTKSMYLLLRKSKINIDSDAFANYFSYNISNRSIDFSYALEIIKELANNTYDVNELWKMAIALAYHDDSKGEEAVRFLIAHGANVNHIFKEGHLELTPLLYASGVYPVYPSIIKILLGHGANINQKLAIGTPLSYTIGRRQSRDNKRAIIIELLLEHGANL